MGCHEMTVSPAARIDADDYLDLSNPTAPMVEALLDRWTKRELCATCVQSAVRVAVGETVIDGTPPVPLLGVSIGINRGCHQNGDKQGVSSK